MRSFFKSFWAIAACVAALSVNPAFAEDAPAKDAVRIETDQEAKAFVFLIDDKPVALLDESGLHVVEHISYGGMLTDKGQDSARRDIEEKLGEAADE
jgi:hypothetical protein